MDCLYIVIPAYNEEANISQVVKDWYPVAEQAGGASKLVIIDDGSTDRTYQRLQQLAKTRPNLIPITKKNGGHGAAVLSGYLYGLEQGADYIFQTDSDGQTLPEEFWPFWKRRKKYEMIIGDRTRRQDGLTRVIVTKVLKLVIRACFLVTIPDANTPFRLMDAKSLREEIRLVPKDFFLSNVLLSVIYVRHRRRVKYLPITFRPRQGGKNSINLRRIIGIGRQSLKDFKELNKRI